jgi:hypothetical protein
MNGRNPDDVHWLMPDTPPDAYSDHVLAWHSSLREGRPSVWEAYKQLPALCGNEHLTMFGVARGDGDVEPIPTAAWATLEISHDARAGFVAEIPLNPGARWWTRLRLLSAAVQRIWPPPGGSVLRRLPTADEVKVWYLERVAKHDPSQPSPSRPDDEKAGRDYFRAIGRRTGEPLKDMVRAARAKHAPGWAASGPKGRKAHAHAQRANLA